MESRSQLHRHGSDGSRARAARDGIFAKRRRLKRDEVGRFTHQFHIGAIFALEDLAHEDELAVFVPIAQAIAHQAAIQRRGKLGGKVAHLIGVAEDHQARLLLLDHRAQGERIAIRCVLGERR